MSVPKFTELSPAERSRQYFFPDSEAVELTDVRRIAVSESGTHRLETGDGLKHIIPTGWLCISIDMDDWTF